jgi:protocatechuate 3,4-dioxygenase, beta subunit
MLSVVASDRESETRTPAHRLYRIPEAARDPFAPCPPAPLVRAGESDLTRIARGRPPASGEAIAITGCILDEDLRPVRRTLVEVWGANAHGRYSHLVDASRNDAPLDPNFYGFGRLVTDHEGRYQVRTIKPGAYIARTDIAWWRPPHVHFSIVGSGARLVTQMYFPDEPLNQKDFIFLVVPPADRNRIIAAPVVSRSGDRAFSFDIVIRGRFQTPPDVDD